MEELFVNIAEEEKEIEKKKKKTKKGEIELTDDFFKLFNKKEEKTDITPILEVTETHSEETLEENKPKVESKVTLPGFLSRLESISGNPDYEDEEDYVFYTGEEVDLVEEKQPSYLEKRQVINEPTIFEINDEDDKMEEDKPFKKSAFNSMMSMKDTDEEDEDFEEDFDDEDYEDDFDDEDEIFEDEESENTIVRLPKKLYIVPKNEESEDDFIEEELEESEEDFEDEIEEPVKKEVPKTFEIEVEEDDTDELTDSAFSDFENEDDEEDEDFEDDSEDEIEEESVKKEETKSFEIEVNEDIEDEDLEEEYVEQPKRESIFKRFKRFMLEPFTLKDDEEDEDFEDDFEDEEIEDKPTYEELEEENGKLKRTVDKLTKLYDRYLPMFEEEIGKRDQKILELEEIIAKYQNGEYVPLIQDEEDEHVSKGRKV